MFGVCFLPKVLSECSPVYAEQDTMLSNVVKTTGFGVRETWVWVLAPPLTSWEALASHPSLTFCLNLADTRLMDCWEDINDRVLSGESSIYWEFLMHWPLWLLKLSPAWFPLQFQQIDPLPRWNWQSLLELLSWALRTEVPEIPSGTIVCLGFRTGSCASLQGNVMGNGEELRKKEGVRGKSCPGLRSSSSLFLLSCYS